MHARSDALRPLWSATMALGGRLRAVPMPIAGSEKQGLKTALSALRVAATRGAADGAAAIQAARRNTEKPRGPMPSGLCCFAI